MNPVIEAAKGALTMGNLMGAMTLFFILSFVVWTVWAWWPGNNELMERAARMPFDDKEP